MRGPGGVLLVSRMLIDDIRVAERPGDLAHAATLKRALRHFIEQRVAPHPRVVEQARRTPVAACLVACCLRCRRGRGRA